VRALSRRRPDDGSPSLPSPDLGWGFSLSVMYLPIHKVSYLAEALSTERLARVHPRAISCESGRIH